MSDNDFLIELLREIQNGMKDISIDVKDVKSDISEIKITDAIQNEQLTLHMKRSDANEKSIVLLKEYIDGAIEELESKVPQKLNLKKKLSYGLGILATLTTVIISILRIMGKI